MNVQTDTQSTESDSSEGLSSDVSQLERDSDLATRRNVTMMTVALVAPFIVLVVVACISAYRATVRVEQERAEQERAERIHREARRLYEEARSSDYSRDLDMISSQLGSGLYP